MTFALDISRFVAKAKDRADLVVRKVVLDVGNRLVYRSPVGNPSLWQSPPPPGYVGGRFRANWQHGFGTPPAGDLPDIDQTGAAAARRIAAGVQASPAIGMHYIVNNLPYAQRIEVGHSKQAPQGVVGLTVLEFQQLANGAAME